VSNIGDKPAFPNVPCKIQNDDTLHVWSGLPRMTLRQYYKAAALTGYMAQPDNRAFSGDPKDVAALDAWREELMRKHVKFVAFYADAMLAEDEEHANK